jgi:uncharacterized membrane protein
LCIADSSKRNAELWGSQQDRRYERGDLNGLYWFASAGEPREGTTVLARVAVEGDAVDGAPLLAVRQHGKGRVLWLGTDDTHYMREFVGDHHFYRLWQNMIAWAANAEP